MVQGYLKKKVAGGIWSKRWFILHDRYLSFAKKEPVSVKDFESSTIGSINLWTVKEVSVDGSEITIKLLLPSLGSSKLPKQMSLNRVVSMATGKLDESWVLKADSSDTAQRWVQAMFAGAFEGSAQRAFDATGSGISQLVPNDSSSLHVDRKDTTRLRDTGLLIARVKVVSPQKKTLFESHRFLFAETRMITGKIPLDATVHVELERGEKVVGKLVSHAIREYKSQSAMGGRVFSVTLADEKVSPDAVVVVIEQDYMSAILNLPFEPESGLVMGVAFGLVSFLYGVIGFKLAFLLAFSSLIMGLGGIVFVKNGPNVISSVKIVSWHDAQVIVSKIGKLNHTDERQSKRLSKKRASSKRAPADSIADGLLDEGEEIEEISDGPEFSLKEKACIASMREMLQDCLVDQGDTEKLAEYHKYIDNDFRMIRFVRARNLKADKAAKLLRTAVEWRISYRVNHIKDEFTPPRWILQYAGCKDILDLLDQGFDTDRLPWYFRDNDGRLAVYLRAGHLNQKKLYKKLENDPDKLFHIGVWLFEMFQMDLDRWFAKNNQSVPNQVTAIIDLQGFSISNQIPVSLALTLVKKYLGKVLDAYPEVLGKVLIINAPWLFHSVWSVFSPFFPPRVIEKIKIQGSKDLYKNIANLMPKDEIPAMYGGPYSINGDDLCTDRIPCQGPYLPDKGESFLVIDKTNK